MEEKDGTGDRGKSYNLHTDGGEKISEIVNSVFLALLCRAFPSDQPPFEEKKHFTE